MTPDTFQTIDDWRENMEKTAESDKVGRHCQCSHNEHGQLDTKQAHASNSVCFPGSCQQVTTESGTYWLCHPCRVKGHTP